MKEFIKKLISMLEEKKEIFRKDWNRYGSDEDYGNLSAYEDSISIVNQLAEEYINCSTNTSTDCSKCSRRSWYQKGYADAEKSNGWIPCSGCNDCQHKECEHYGKS